MNKKITKLQQALKKLEEAHAALWASGAPDHRATSHIEDASAIIIEQLEKLGAPISK